MRVPPSELGREGMRSKRMGSGMGGHQDRGKGPKTPRRSHKLESRHRIKQFTTKLKRQRRR